VVVYECVSETETERAGGWLGGWMQIDCIRVVSPRLRLRYFNQCIWSVDPVYNQWP
jgi:hypothetical protein